LQLQIYHSLLEHHNNICASAASAEEMSKAKDESTVYTCSHLLCAASYIQRINAHPDLLYQVGVIAHLYNVTFDLNFFFVIFV
jgi:hypothetical protein